MQQLALYWLSGDVQSNMSSMGASPLLPSYVSAGHPMPILPMPNLRYLLNYCPHARYPCQTALLPSPMVAQQQFICLARTSCIESKMLYGSSLNAPSDQNAAAATEHVGLQALRCRGLPSPCSMVWCKGIMLHCMGDIMLQVQHLYAPGYSCKAKRVTKNG